MNRPWALIEGELALPDARLLGVLPPPFGARRRPARTTSPPEVQRNARPEARPEAKPETQQESQAVEPPSEQQTVRKVLRHKKPVYRKPLAPGTLFRFFYAVRQPRDFSARIDAQLAEARYYLNADKTRAHSSRKDYVLGAAIFAATGMALAWLLTTSAMHDAEKLATPVIERTIEDRPEGQVAPTRVAAGSAPTVDRKSASAPKPMPLAARPAKPEGPSQAMRSVNPMPSAQVSRAVQSRPARQAGLVDGPLYPSRHIEPNKSRSAPARNAATDHTTMAGPGTRPNQSTSYESEIDSRPASSRSMVPSVQASAAAQAHGSTRAFPIDATPEQAALREWAAQQRRTSDSAAASAPATATENTWNARMTQRRIVDDPNAFGVGTPRP